MSNDRRALLRRELLKEELAKEHAAKPAPATGDNDHSKLIGSADIGKALQGGSNEFIESPEAMGTGALQSVTLNLSDELGAGLVDMPLAAAKGELKGLPPLVDLQGGPTLASKYREMQQSRQAANKDLADKHPGSYFGGEVIGGIATLPFNAMGTGGKLATGLSLPYSSGTRLVNAAGEVSPKVAAFLAGKSPQAMEIAASQVAGKITPEAAELALKMAPQPGVMKKALGMGTKNAIEGLSLGATYGFGASEKNLSDDPYGVLQDTASGAGMGSIAGAAVGVSGSMLGSAKDGVADMWKKHDFTRKISKQFGMGQRGLDPYSTEGSRLQLTLANKNLPNKTVNEIMQADNYNGQMVGDSLDPLKNPNAAKPVNIDAEANTSMGNIRDMLEKHPSLLENSDPKTNKLGLKILDFKGGDLTPLEARNLKDELYELSYKLDGLTSDSAHFTAQEANILAGKINAKLKVSVPEYKVAAEKFEQFRSFIPETILQPGVPLDKRSVYLGNLKNQETKLLSKTKELLGGATMPGASKKDMSAVGLKELQQRLRTLQRTNPKSVEKMGGTSEEVFGKLQDRSDTMGSVYQSQGVEPNQSFVRTATGTVVGSGQGFGFNMANRAGQVTKAVTSFKPVKVSKALFSAADDKLMSIAAKLKASKASAALGEGLEKALLNKDEQAKIVVIKKINDIQEYRQMFGSDENENK